MFFLRAEKDGLTCLINTTQIVAIFAPIGKSGASNKCKAALDDGTTAEILAPFSELEDIIEAAHVARFAEAQKFLKGAKR